MYIPGCILGTWLFDDIVYNGREHLAKSLSLCACMVGDSVA